MKLEVHAARKEYRCYTPTCGRRIPKGAAYTLESYPPGELPFSPRDWVNRRFCSSCRPLPEGASSGSPCPAVLHGEPCSLPATHHPATEHEFAIGLF